MKATWIMQTNMGKESDVQVYVDAVKATGANVIEVEYIPFSEQIPIVEVDGPIVLYGAVNFIKQCEKNNLYLDGIFGNSDTFTYQSWAEHYGEMLLNSPDSIQLTTIKEVINLNIDNDLIFVRPQNDTKSLVGSVWDKNKFKEWCKDASIGNYPEVNGDTPIVIGAPYGIDAEWRLFIVDNKVVSSSQYYKNGKLHKELGSPQAVLDFAEKVIKKWNPVPVYTLDICRSAGNCYIMEVQGFNSAGHYASDIKKVAEEVNKVAEEVNKVAIEIWERKN